MFARLLGKLFLIYTYISKIIFPEKSLSVRMFVCLSVPSVPSRPRKKVTETENFAKQSCQIYFKGDKKNTQSHAAVLGEAKPSYVYSILKPHFRVSSPPQSRSQAVVCVSTPRIYPRRNKLSDYLRKIILTCGSF